MTLFNPSQTPGITKHNTVYAHSAVPVSRSHPTRQHKRVCTTLEQQHVHTLSLWNCPIAREQHNTIYGGLPALWLIVWWWFAR